MMTTASDSRMVLFGDGESKLSLLCCDDEPEEAAALHLMPNIQVCNVCKMFKHVVITWDNCLQRSLLYLCIHHSIDFKR